MLEDLTDFAFGNVKASSEMVDGSVVPLFTKDPQGRPEPVGSSVALIANRRRFLITAHHVVDVARGELYYPTSEDLSSVDAAHFLTCDADSIDVAVCELGSLPGVFAPLDVASFIEQSQAPEGYLVAVGFPATKTKVYGATVRSRLQKLVSRESDGAEYRRLRADRSTNIAVDFDKRRTVLPSGVTSTFPDPNGMSGGPLLWLYKEALLRPVAPKVVAILTRWDDISKSGMVATRVRGPLAVIRREFCADDIPEHLVAGVRIGRRL